MATLEQINKVERVLMDRVDAMYERCSHGKWRILPALGGRYRKAAENLRKRIREGNYDDVTRG